MRIRLIESGCEAEVYAIQFYRCDFNADNDVIFIYADSISSGLKLANIKDIDIIDKQLGGGFNFMRDEETNINYIIWNYFSDLGHLGSIFSLEDESVDVFDAARREYESKKYR